MPWLHLVFLPSKGEEASTKANNLRIRLLLLLRLELRQCPRPCRSNRGTVKKERAKGSRMNRVLRCQLRPHRSSPSNRAKLSTKARDSRMNPARPSVLRRQNPSSKARLRRAEVRDLKMNQALRVALHPWSLPSRARVRTRGTGTRANKRLVLAAP